MVGTLSVTGNTNVVGTLDVTGDTKIIAKFACNNNTPRSKQTAIVDTSMTIPADGVIAGHADWSDAKGDVETLRDAVSELQTKLDDALAVLRTFGFLNV